MSDTQTLPDKAAGDPVIADDVNKIHNALNGAFVGRDTNGVPTPLQLLGTEAIPWGQIHAQSLALDGEFIDLSLQTSPAYRMVSGIDRRDVLGSGFKSGFPVYLIPGVTNTLEIDASTEDLVYEIKGERITLTGDITLSPLTTAADPSLATNRALINDASATGADRTRLYGEYRQEQLVGGAAIPEEITIDTIGAGFSAKDQSFQVFRNGSELFIGFLDGTKIKQCFRGYFYNNSLLPIRRETFSNNDVIELMQAHWLFLDKDKVTVDITLKAPIYEFSQPAGVSGDYWFDLKTDQWNRHNGSTFVAVDRLYIGMAVTDNSAVIGARTVEYFANYLPRNNVSVGFNGLANVELESTWMSISVGGRTISYGPHKQEWDIVNDLVTTNNDSYAGSEQASTFYYMYIGDEGEEIVTDMEPYYRGELYGWYHPFHIWRCVGRIFNDSGSDFSSDPCNVDNTFDLPNAKINGRRDIRCRTIPGDMIEQNAIDDAELAFNAVSPPKLSVHKNAFTTILSGGQKSSLTFVVSSGHVKSITLSGVRPVAIGILGGTNIATSGYIEVINGGVGPAIIDGFIRIRRTSGGGFDGSVYSHAFDVGLTRRVFGMGFAYFELSPPAGVNTYQIEVAISNTDVNNTIQVVGAQLMIIEL